MDIDRILYLIFAIPCGLMEFYISKTKFSSKTERSASKDRGSFTSLWLVIMSSQALTVYLIRQGLGTKIIPNGPFKNFVWIPTSVIIYLLGHRIRHQSIRQLGDWFTTIVRTTEEQELIQSGWYARMRHPSYTGCLMYFLGVSALLNNWLGFFGIMLPISLVFRYRVYVEEKALHHHFGRKYDEYRQKVPNMFFPKLFLR